jgi:hypothetical protein
MQALSITQKYKNCETNPFLRRSFCIHIHIYRYRCRHIITDTQSLLPLQLVVGKPDETGV